MDDDGLAHIIDDASIVHNYEKKFQKYLELYELIPKDLEEVRHLRLRDELGTVFFHSVECKDPAITTKDFERIEKK